MKTLIRVLISAGLLVWLWFGVRDDIPQILHALKNVNVPLFFSAFVLMLIAIGVTAKRLQLVFDAEGLKLKFSDALNISFVGCFFNNFLPTSMGGDIVKVMCAARITGEPVKSVTSVLMDRIFGLFTFILIPSISLFFFMKNIHSKHVPIFVYSVLAIAFFCFILLFHKDTARRFGFIKHLLRFFKWEEKARKIYNGLNAFKNRKAVMVEALLLSIVGQALSIIVRFLIVVALGAHTSVFYFFLLIPIVDLISMAPSLGGLGLREWGYKILLTSYIGVEYAAALGILWLGVLIGLSVIGGIIYLVRHDYHIQLKGKRLEPSS